MVALPTPFEAYRLDLSRAGTEDDFGSADSLWLLVAHCLSRFSEQPETARLDLAERSAQALEQFAASAHGALEPDSVQPLDEGSLGELQKMIEGLHRYAERAGQEQIAKAVIDMSGRITASGALMLAYTMVGSAREAVRDASARSGGLLLAEQGRIARLLGNLDDAEQLYAQVHGIGERTDDQLLLGRAAIGRGNTSRLRGNYPKAREFFTEALAISEAASIAEIQRLAHQGLTIILGEARDYDGALFHGWLTFVQAGGRQKEESEALINLANISVLAGQPKAALHAILKSIPNIADGRILLPALGIGALAAARCGEVSMIEPLTEKLERAVSESTLPYENANALLTLSQAFAELGRENRAFTTRERAKAIAEEHGFHELAHVADQNELTRHPVEAPREWSDSTREVLANLEGLECALVL